MSLPHTTGSRWTIERVAAAQIPEVWALERRLAGAHACSTLDQAHLMYEHGALLAIRNDDGAMIAEAQLITERIPESRRALTCHLPDQAGYFEGFAVDPAHRGRGHGAALVVAAGEVIRAAGKRESWATARVENGPSIRDLTRAGYRIIGYSDTYYADTDREGARLVLWTGFDTVPRAATAESGESIMIPVGGGDEGDPQARARVQEALATGCVGVGIHRRGGDGSMLVFRRTEPELRALTAGRQAFVRAFLPP
jgi:ribosomal protein S18 acetylase RimI-like enzyme